MTLDERTTLLNDRAENVQARYALYWMQIFKRASHNHALNFAVRCANERRLSARRLYIPPDAESGTIEQGT